MTAYRDRRLRGDYEPKKPKAKTQAAREPKQYEKKQEAETK